MTNHEFQAIALSNPINRELIARLSRLGIDDCYLTAGCLFQTVWNHLSGRSPEWGIKDYDVFYFDDRDLSWDAEDRIIRRIADATADLPIFIETKNQARVHLWYPERFGSDYPQLGSARAGIDLYLISCTCIGIEVRTGDLYAPNGLDDLVAGVLRMNPRNPKRNLFLEKAKSYQQRWPWLKIVDQ